MTTAHAIISRKEAHAQGLRFYFTGKPCRRGHIAKRRCPAGTCLTCEAEKDPTAARDRANVWYEANRERALANVRAYKATNLELVREKDRAYHRANRHVNNAATRRYRLNHPEKCRGVHAEWKRANPERVCLHARNRRARIHLAEGHHTAEDIRRIYQAQKGKCALCQEKVSRGYHVDHITPLAKGGSNWPKNLQILCSTCNYRKSSRDPLEHARSIGLLL